MLAGTVVNAARDTHPAFDDRRNPDAAVLRFLSRYVRELHGKVAAIDETRLAVEEVVDFPLADFEAGVALPAHRYLAGASARLTSTSASGDPLTVPVEVVPWAHRHDPKLKPASCWIVNGVAYFLGPERSWSNVAEVAFLLVETPSELATLADTLAIPDEAEAACVAACALFMAKRGHKDEKLPEIDVNLFIGEAERAERAYLDDVANRNTGVVTRTRDVMSGGWL